MTRANSCNSPRSSSSQTFIQQLEVDVLTDNVEHEECEDERESKKMPTTKPGGHDVLIVAHDRNNLRKRNVIFPYDALDNFMDENFICKKCFSSESFGGAPDCWNCNESQLVLQLWRGGISQSKTMYDLP
jgi:hypothetical protein